MRTCLAIAFLVFAGSAVADDGWVGNGGSPRLMASHPTIRMVKEIVTMRVGIHETTVDAQFWFHNDGRATSARLGFPDEGGEWEPGDKPTLQNFRSWIGGKVVKTKFLAGEDGQWHVKAVRFPAKSTVYVRNSYTVKTGIGTVGPAATYQTYAAYTLHTGASWKGPIGEVIVKVSFAPSIPKPTRLESSDWATELLQRDPAALPRFIKNQKHTVLWHGLEPRLRGGRVSYYRRNLEPTEKENVHLTLFPRYDWKFLKKQGS